MSDPIASIWCCRPCRCGTVVHTEDGRDPDNACTHGDAICGACAPGDCDECLDDLQQPMSLGDCIAELPSLLDHLDHVINQPDPWDNGVAIDNPLDHQADQTGWDTGGRRFA